MSERILGLHSRRLQKNKFGQGTTTFQDLLYSPASVGFAQILFTIISPVIAYDLIKNPEEIKYADQYILPYFACQSFDWDEYWRAINQAKSHDNFHVKLKESHSTLIKNRNDFDSIITRSNVNEIIRLASESYVTTKNQKIRLIDRSGMLPALGYKKPTSILTANNVLQTSIIQNFSSELRVPHRNILANSASYKDINSLVTATSEDQQRIEYLRTSVEQGNQYNEQKLTEFIRDLASKDLFQDQKYRDTAQRTYSNFNLSFGSDNENNRIIYIDNYNINHTFRPSFNSKNQHLEIFVNNDEIQIRNTSNDFVTIDTISFYNNGNITTRSGNDFVNLELLPPRSQTTESLRISQTFNSNGLRATENGITADRARQTFYDYGLIIRYRTTSSNNEYIMDEVKSLSLMSLLESEPNKPR